MKVVVNEVTGIREAFVDGKLLSIGKTELMNSNDKGYFIANCEAHYPDGSKETVSAVIWSASCTGDNEELFTIDGPITLRTQLEGDYAGNAVVELAGGKRVDISKLAKFIPATEEVEATA